MLSCTTRHRYPASSCARRFSDYSGRGGRLGQFGGSGRGRGRGLGFEGRGPRSGRGQQSGRGNQAGRGQQHGRGYLGQGSALLEKKFHRGGPPKENFAKKFLEPAAKGVLVGKHDSGIPRLAARKGKGHQLHDAFDGEDFDPVEAVDLDFLNTSSSFVLPSQATESGENGHGKTHHDMRSKVLQTIHPPFIDDEDEYDEIDLDGFDPKFSSQVSTDRYGGVILTYDPILEFDEFDEDDGDDYAATFGDDEDDNNQDLDDYEDDESNLVGHDEISLSDENIEESNIEDEIRLFDEDLEEFNDPHDRFHDRDLLDIDSAEDENYADFLDSKLASKPLPLAVEGDSFEDFLNASYNHPSKFAVVSRYNHHPDSLREPKPFFPKNRLQPPEEFVISHKRFVFVSGLPHFVEPDGTLGTMENPIHRLEVSKMVSDLIRIPTSSIFPASMTSAFVGYSSKEKFYKFMREGPQSRTFDRKLKISLHRLEESEEMDEITDGATLKIENVPADMTLARFAHVLFPAGTELGEIYGPISLDDLKKVGTTTVLVRMKSEEQALSAVSSTLVQDHMAMLGRRVVHFFRARRQLVFGGFTGPNKCHTYKVRGNKLTVDCDSPSKTFLQSHESVVQLAAVDESITKEQISKFMEPFCADRRDVTGSIEFATCLQNDRTQIVYVGFDRPGEAEAFLKSCSGLINLGKGPVTARLVREEWIPTAKLQRETRSLRSQDELLETLDNWEKFVDMKQVEKLESLGVNREVLADVFRTMRFKNLSYGPLDWAMAREKLDPKKLEQGQQIRETMQLYIDTLLEIASSDDITNGMSYTDIMSISDEGSEDVDIMGKNLLERDTEQVAAIKQKRKTVFFDR